MEDKEKEFKYDVAFSFLAQDEDLALQICNLIEDRVRVFLYSEKQEELAGRDGEEVFNRVFGTEARIVFVLYRRGWGESPWTRIEETAIRNRAYNEGYDFVLFAPLDENPIPKWLPKTRIWVGIDRWGIEGAASIIEAKVQEAGGFPREETVQNRVDRLNREIEAEKKKKGFLDSFDGVNAAKEELKTLFSELDRVITGGTKTEESVNLTIEKGAGRCAVCGDGFSIFFDWSAAYNNSVQSSALYLSLWEGFVSISGGNPFERPTLLKKIELQFDLSNSGIPIWKERRDSEKSYSTNALAKLALTMLLNKILESKKFK